MVHQWSEFRDDPHAASSGWRRLAAASENTAFDLAVFDQCDWWVDQEGATHPIAELSAEDRAELAGWLYRHSRHFYLQVLARALVISPTLSLGAVPDVTFQGADEWMRHTSLMRALEEADGRKR